MKILLAALVLLSTPAMADPPPSPYIEDMTWPELRTRQQAGTDTVIIPTGGTEQNGPHIVIGKHNRIVAYTAGAIARGLGNAVAAPVLAYVPEGSIEPAGGHMLFPGTISLREEAFALVLEDAARSFKAHGFKRICFIGDHGANQKPQADVAAKLSAEWKSQNVQVLQVSDYYDNKPAHDFAVGRGIADPEAHAGFMDASEVMALDKGNVRPGEFKPFAEKDFTRTGAKGNPTKASAADGQTLLDLRVRSAIDRIKRDSGRP